MTASENQRPLDAWGFIRRQWWVILGAALVAAAAAAALGLGSSVLYEAKTLVVVDTVTLASNGRLPRPDALISVAESAVFRAELAERTGQAEDAIESGLNVYTVGSPQTELWIAYSDSSAEMARELSAAATELLMEHEAELSSPVVELQREYVEDSERIIEELRDSDNPDAPYQLWSVQRNLSSDLDTLEYLETVYTPSSGPVESESTVQEALARGAVGGFAVGLLVGAVIAVFREVRYRRSAEAPVQA